MAERNCCCNWGAAIKGEYPEFGCRDCQIHRGDLGEPERCKRHQAQWQADHDLVVDIALGPWRHTPWGRIARRMLGIR